MDNTLRATSENSWRSPFETATGEESSLTTDIREAMGHEITEPSYTIDMACAAAEASEALCVQLRSQWSLYTPQQAATVASALYAQVSAAAEALRGVSRVLGQMTARGDTGPVSDPGDQVDGSVPETSARLSAAAEAIDAVVGDHAGPAVGSLLRMPSTAPLPADVHEAVAAAAALLGPTTALTECDPSTPTPGIPAELADCCGCEIDIEHRGQLLTFGRGDGCWSVDLKVVMPDSIAFYENVAELGVSLETAHPGHLAEEIRRVLPT
ncbi:hypothetical protein [Streptomyces sp. NPDC048606]|uniref:hypothetical protein n=1 Tax=Streptomyces sp. NPDC048606 TaxID=3154726 RepID=UPI0034345852